MGSSGQGEVVVGKEEVIAKLKDDGDFDKLRLKIIRKLKENEELRQHITSIVKQSEVLNRAGAENMKPRQLCDVIFEEVGEKVMSHLSDSLWQIIRSDDGMKGEITETVQSVYDKLANPKGKDEVLLSTSDAMPSQGETASAMENGDSLHENEPQEPPGFTLLPNHPNNNNHKDQDKGNAQVQRQGCKVDSHPSQDTLVEDDHNIAPPGFSKEMEHSPVADCSDEDPEVPPGFG
ncbi:hypothetical protein RYX36_026135 [Vicia faba]